MNQTRVYLNISADELQRMYSGSAKFVLAYDTKGRRIRFPINILQPFVTRQGILGWFEIEFDSDNKFKNIKRLK